MSNDLHEFQIISRLQWPLDADVIASLGLVEKQVWYSSIDAREMVFLGQNREFKRFWKIHYLWPLRMKRLVYKLKRILSFHA